MTKELQINFGGRQSFMEGYIIGYIRAVFLAATKGSGFEGNINIFYTLKITTNIFYYNL
jgi:hypothetical protein